MKFQQQLIRARLLRRYQRFLADVEIDGEVVTVHCPNPGSMIGLNVPGSIVWLSRSQNPSRRLAYTLELIQIYDGGGQFHLVGINTGMPNRLVEEAIRDGGITHLAGYSTLRREVRYGLNSRIDLLLEDENHAPCYVEVKNVHLSRTPGLAEFPDCVTARGAKHLRELSLMVESGARAVMIFCVQRSDCAAFSLAQDLDPAYAEAFADATASGVETLIYSCHISAEGIRISQPLELRAPDQGRAQQEINRRER
jgi:sugar fermentation stimulation protein A